MANIHCHPEASTAVFGDGWIPGRLQPISPTYSGKRLLAEFPYQNYIRSSRFEASRPSDARQEELIQSVEVAHRPMPELDGPLLNAVKLPDIGDALLCGTTTQVRGSRLSAQYYRATSTLMRQ